MPNGRIVAPAQNRRSAVLSKVTPQRKILLIESTKPRVSIREKGFCFLAITALLTIFASHCFARQVEVVYVYDGDTVKFADQQGEYRVRLVGTDAPETSKGHGEPGQPYSQKARKHLEGLVLNRNVEIREYGFDVYGRILAVVYIDGRNVNVEMVQSGLAEADRLREGQGLDMIPYWGAEKEAREAGRNIWSLGENYMSPREWRRTHQ